MKRAALVLSLFAVLFILVGYVMVSRAFVPALMPCLQAVGDLATLQQCASQAVAQAIQSDPLSLTLLGLGGLISLAASLLGLVRTAQTGRWGWFVALLLLGTLGALLYGLAGPTEHAK